MTLCRNPKPYITLSRNPLQTKAQRRRYRDLEADASEERIESADLRCLLEAVAHSGFV